ncbi:hypothetical protein Pmar_PMAR017882 [Perkinsus marinus ATCC 50983]|uniref:Uncharacterized protein n=1 Tax=Perkinsus marinus (strain ATCC 50983 / TXsc) TaxID=423536 RepID=C5KEV9_PERM5|nr:hypothetical protein Pmar_PMAR017882 [Perkinsus marinus ATCC 50983]EER16985.1 hypothetical protein Pmar_PMAR017882 [Perkinsus marinus ATCC 50983]|eukprot:XP_002785189.1 hypothetical protein Pmar_PMAR017882 [Perkinsus marinus ATCC 50983]
MSLVSASVAAASQGAAGAIVGALIASVTDPVTNRVLVERCSLKQADEAALPQALAEVDVERSIKYFQTTLPTNFIKFPLFEVLNEIIRRVDIPKELRGVITGIIFTTATLPITNYRFNKSMNREVALTDPSLWTAYLPTVVRDVIYANSRNTIAAFMARTFPNAADSTVGRISTMFVTVVLACIISAPGNEWRGYSLQRPDRKKSPKEFFQLERFLRSTIVGACVMGTSLGVATVVGPPVQQALPKLKDPKVFSIIVLLAVYFLAKKGCRKEEEAKVTSTSESSSA